MFYRSISFFSVSHPSTTTLPLLPPTHRYNAYRFHVQSAHRLQAETGTPFVADRAAAAASANVLDRWLAASTADLARFVRTEMAAYRLYTVVPRLMAFIADLTNVYVRYNRSRLKGKPDAGGGGDDEDEGGDDASTSSSFADRLAGLSTLHTALTSLAVAMAPFTPFLCETMWRNLRKGAPHDPPLPESVHWAPYPDPPPDSPADADVRAGVDVVVRAVELARTVRERAARPLRQPLKTLTLVAAPATLARLTPDLRRYITAEANVRDLIVSDDVAAWTAVKLEPDWPALGKRLGRALPAVKAGLNAAGPDLVAAIEAGDAVSVGGVQLEAGEVKVLRRFKAREGAPATLDGDGDGFIFIALDLALDASLAAAGVARDVATRVQKARKAAGLVAGDAVCVWVGGKGGGALPADLQSALDAEAAWLAASLGAAPRPLAELPAGADELLREAHALPAGEFELVLTRP